ncbi:MAG: cytochrome c [Alphaproteobacteria bacterium]|nr:cytochrome c [Alphaproteobacteria bacterium]
MRKVPLIGGLAAVAVGVVASLWLAWHLRRAPDHADATLGRVIYDGHCASCHGANLEGQADWRRRKPDGKLPAPPHDETGHTWHHSDRQLFEITKYGVRHFAPAGYASDMPAFGDVLSDGEIRSALEFIRSRWSVTVRERQRSLSRE